MWPKISFRAHDPAYGRLRETPDPRKRDAAFSTLEHLMLHAHHSGVTICIENTTSEMGDPAFLRAFVDETRLPLRFNFDIGHAHLSDGAEEDRIENCFEPLRDLVASVHVTIIMAKKTSIYRRTMALLIGPRPSKRSSPGPKRSYRSCWS